MYYNWIAILIVEFFSVDLSSKLNEYSSLYYVSNFRLFSYNRDYQRNSFLWWTKNKNRSQLTSFLPSQVFQTQGWSFLEKCIIQKHLPSCKWPVKAMNTNLLVVQERKPWNRWSKNMADFFEGKLFGLPQNFVQR